MPSILARLFSDLDIAVFERTEQGMFTLISDMPRWLKKLKPEVGPAPDDIDPSSLFLFLEDFLERHASYWESPQNEALLSGVWTEMLPDGQPQLLQAEGLYIDGRPLLLIKVPPHQESWPIYQHAREQRLENEQLIEEINKREILLHCIVHDLSNPLAGIKGSFELLNTENLVEEEGMELTHIGLRQVRKMQDLIRSILSTFANEVKPIVPTLIGEDVAPDLRVCAADVVASFSATAILKDISIKLSHPDQAASFKVVGEKERLERVLFNLLANALRHSPKGSSIHVSLTDEPNHIAISVEDEGTGVPEHVEEHLFERFSQGHESTGLAGLGLYYCRITVEHWGGHIGYKRGPNGGACFWIRLPKPIKHIEYIAQ